nr:hypothetical protein Itr_chr03CG15610 [Ipomoea trifida]
MLMLRSYVNNEANTASYIMPSFIGLLKKLPFPVSLCVSELTFKIDVLTPLDFSINYAVPQRRKGVCGGLVILVEVCDGKREKLRRPLDSESSSVTVLVLRRLLRRTSGEPSGVDESGEKLQQKRKSVYSK